MSPTERRLGGGFVNDVTRVGDTVRRRPPRDAEYVRRLLHHLERVGWTGAPRHLGSDDEGRDVLSFVDGLTVAERPDLTVDADLALAGVARLARELHDRTAGTPLAGEEEVVCHHDLDPRNTVYRETPDGLVPVAFVDWDLAGPGQRVQDVARIGWQYLRLGPAVKSVADAARRLRLVCDAYDLRDRDELLPTILWWQDRCWRGILAAAEAGEPAMLRLRADGIVDEVRGAEAWTRENADALAARLGT